MAPFFKTVSDHRLWLQALLIVIYAIWAGVCATPNAQGIDFYPLYVGAQYVWQGISPYSQAVSLHLEQYWDALLLNSHVASVVAYPAPFLVFIMPFLTMPEPFAALLWSALLMYGFAYALIKTSERDSDVCVWLCFFPLFHALLLRQSTFLWVVIAALCVFKVRERHPVLLGFLLALLPLKPQVGLILLPFAMYQAYQANRKSLVWMFGFSIALWGASFVLMPDWPLQWLREAIPQYQAQAVQFDLSWFFIALAAASIGLSWIAFGVALGLALFPMNDLYALSPLVIFYLGLRTPLVIPAVAASLALHLFETPNTEFVALFYIWAPAMLLCCYLHIKRLWKQPALTSNKTA